jgi:hypothetical protein
MGGFSLNNEIQLYAGTSTSGTTCSGYSSFMPKLSGNISTSSSSSSNSSSSRSSSSSMSYYAYKTFWYELRDLTGIPISGATVNIYDEKTTLLNIFEIDGTTPKSQPITTGIDGLINFAVVDDIVSPSGYKWDDELTFTWSKNTSAGIINFRQIFGEYHVVEVEKTDTKINKTIGNRLAYIWNYHIGLNF